MRTTYTFVTLAVSQAAYAEIAAKLQAIMDQLPASLDGRRMADGAKQGLLLDQETADILYAALSHHEIFAERGAHEDATPPMPGTVEAPVGPGEDRRVVKLSALAIVSADGKSWMLFGASDNDHDANYSGIVDGNWNEEFDDRKVIIEAEVSVRLGAIETIVARQVAPQGGDRQ